MMSIENCCERSVLGAEGEEEEGEGTTLFDEFTNMTFVALPQRSLNTNERTQETREQEYWQRSRSERASDLAILIYLVYFLQK